MGEEEVTDEEAVLKAALDNGWRAKKMPRITPNNGWWIRKGRAEIAIYFGWAEGQMAEAGTRSREFETAQDVITYLKEAP